ncbi:transmembrane protein 147 [Harpegnathos saltator]|uniref:transmembrane protein 147 n=1 Tax=Harpegnathos saltator TaxID=610380 RepID=UPI000DBEDE30|nr:transmembrane protein 147 [Harpegnathos saltator]
MTLYHFGNCLALVYVPYHLTYKYSGLSEYGAFWKCIQASGIYIFTQLVKMLALATFFPTADNVGEEGFNVFGEFLKSSIDLADLIGFLLVLNSIPGKGYTKVLTVGIGWAGAEGLLTRFLLLWVDARDTEFDWKYIQKSLESSINLVQHITTATLVWLWSRHDLRRSLVPIVIGMLLLTVYRSLVFDFLSSLLLAGPWFTLIIKAVTTFFMNIMTLHIYAGVADSIGIF